MVPQAVGRPQQRWPSSAIVYPVSGPLAFQIKRRLATWDASPSPLVRFFWHILIDDLFSLDLSREWIISVCFRTNPSWNSSRMELWNRRNRESRFILAEGDHQFDDRSRWNAYIQNPCADRGVKRRSPYGIWILEGVV